MSVSGACPFGGSLTDWVWFCYQRIATNSRSPLFSVRSISSRDHVRDILPHRGVCGYRARGDPLNEIESLIDWKLFRPRLVTVYQSGSDQGGHPHTDVTYS